MAGKSQSNKPSDPASELTTIQGRIHCPATTDSGGTYTDEVEQIQIDHFLQTLADIALAVASRKIASQGGKVA
jgi:hypothetical protein